MSRFGPFTLALCVLFMVFAAPAAHAEGFVTPFVGFSFNSQAGGCGNPATCEQRRTNLGISAGTSHGIFGFEEDISYIKEFYGTQAGAQNAVLTITSNMIFLKMLPPSIFQPSFMIFINSRETCRLLIFVYMPPWLLKKRPLKNRLFKKS